MGHVPGNLDAAAHPVFGERRRDVLSRGASSVQENAVVDGWADWVKPFFELRLFVFVRCVLLKTPEEEFDAISIPSHL